MLVLVPWKPVVLALCLLSGLVLIDFIGSSLVKHKDPFSIERAAQVILEGNQDHRSAPSANSHFGSLFDLEHLCADRSAAEQGVYANEFLALLSPFAQTIIKWRWLGYSWREIALQLEMDRTAVRRAYFREVETLLRSLSRSGDLRRCD
jgi:hypothetical protein